MNKGLLFLIVIITMGACGKKTKSLVGRQFHLVTATAEHAPGIVMISFEDGQKMRILVVRDVLGSNNDVRIAPYKFEEDKLTFGGATYDARKNNRGYDLYRDKHLVYKLIVPRGSELGKMAQDSLRRRKPAVKRGIRPEPIS